MSENAYEHPPKDFAISEGGPLYNLVKKIPFITTPKRGAVFGLCITWLPLVIICAYEGTLYSGVQMPFLFDWAMQMRLLIAFPMMIIIRVFIDNNATKVLKYLGMELLDTEERQSLVNHTFHKARKLSSSVITEIIILLVIVLSTVSMVKSDFFSGLEGGTTTWMAKSIGDVQQLSVAGKWSVFVCIPIVQFFIFRWYWRYIVWILLLFRLSKTNLKLLPTHADKTGGLGILMIAQRSFSLFFVALSVILSGEIINTLIKHPEAFSTVRSEAIGFIVICLVFLLFPLVFFYGKLTKTKNEGLLQLSNLGADLSRKFEREWVNDQPIEKILDEKLVDPSLLYDYAGMYSSLQEMRTLPVTLNDILVMAGMLFVPFIPVLFIQFSIAELLQKISGVLM